MSCENVAVLARYDFMFSCLASVVVVDHTLTISTILHRSCYDFSQQGGDTATVTGKKSSIWGDEVTFPDEFHPSNLHDRRGRLSMANRGPNTNKVRFSSCDVFFLVE